MRVTRNVVITVRPAVRLDLRQPISIIALITLVVMLLVMMLVIIAGESAHRVQEDSSEDEPKEAEFFHKVK